MTASIRVSRLVVQTGLSECPFSLRALVALAAVAPAFWIQARERQMKGQSLALTQNLFFVQAEERSFDFDSVFEPL